MAAATVVADGAAPRSSSAADSYIGSLISLTSKSEIRYEGVLFNINTEESSIGLKNVRSFGTEGRKKDGPQVPPSNKIYEYILFRGSDIKDLQVKSSQPIPPAAPVHDDPAIIRSHYPQGATPSPSLPYPGIRPVPDLSSHIPQGGVPRPPFQGNLPLYQPGRSTGPYPGIRPVPDLGSWGSSPAPTTMDASGLAMPPYWQGYYGGPSNELQQQQSLLRPPLGMSIPPPMQQSMQFPAVNTSLLTGASNLPASQLPEYHHSLIPTMNSGSLSLQSTTQPPSSATASDLSTNLIPDMTFTQSVPPSALSSSLPLASSFPTVLDRNAISPPVSEKPQIAPDPVMSFSSISESMSLLAGSSSSALNEGPMPSLITPGQLLQHGPSTLQSSQTAQKDVEVVQVSSSESPSASSIPQEPAVEAVELDEHALPLHSQTDHKPYQQHRYPGYSYQNNRRGRGRGRGNEISRSATRFTEDFDFTAMNEKFNKDEVWGHLGKSNDAEENGNDVDGTGPSKLETNPVYVKDDFFDSLSCDALGGGSRNGRPRFPEQSRRDNNEAFGDFSRYRGSRGGRGFGGGQSRGGYYGRNYGYNGRGRGGYGTYGNGAY